MIYLKPFMVDFYFYCTELILCCSLIYVLNLSSLFKVLWHIGSKELGHERAYCVPQGSILGPILSKILIFNIFLLNKSFDIATYTGDNTLYISKPTQDLVKTEFILQNF